ncbi:MAG: ROK family protein [Chthoniobacteraceae bacterium]
MSEAAALGIDLGGTQIKAVVLDRDGGVLQRERVETGDSDAQPWAERIGAIAAKHRELPVGLSAPGLAARDRHSIAYMPGRLAGLENLDWTDYLQRSSLVPVTNDAHASLLGEAWIGAAAGLRDVMMLTLGTGVGGAILSEGRLLRGVIGRAGHLGHICLDVTGPPDIVGTPGSLEDFIGNHSIRTRSGGKFATTHELIAAYRERDPFASELWLRSIRALACGLVSLINVVDPEAVIIGGGIAQAGAALFDPLAQELDALEWRPGGHQVRIIPAQLGEWAGAIGAAREAMLAAG